MIIYFLVVSFLGLLVSLLRPFNPDNTRICARMFAWGGLKLLGIRITHEGLEHLADHKSMVVIANHQTNIDLFVHGSVIPHRTVTIGKKNLKFLPLFGQVYWLAGNIMIDRANHAAAVESMSEITEELIKNDISIWFFPEGTRNKGAGLLPFKKGAFYMAIQAGVPIVPICASSYQNNLNFNRLFAGDVIVNVLPPITTEGMTRKDVPALVERARSQMQECISSLDARVD